MDAIDRLRGLVRSWLKHVARFTDRLSGGRVTATHITVLSLAAHLGVAWAIIEGRLSLAAALVVIFGLMDALDGELARLQNKATNLGIVLDATSDRLKETFIYAAIVVYLSRQLTPEQLFWVVLALGFSLSLSYIKAKGEAVLASQTGSKLDPQALNRFIGGDSLMQFDVRMALIVAGLLLDALWSVALIIAVSSLFSIGSRYLELKHALERD